MLILDTIQKSTIWGASRLSLFGANPQNAPIGSLYTVAGNAQLSCTIQNGQFRGQRLFDVYRENQPLFGYTRFSAFPLLIGFVDASDNLSIQIHPDDDYARTHECTEFGKTESWYFLHPPESGFIINGCNCATMEEMRARAACGDWDGLFGHLPVKAGDYVYVQAGTLHAMTTGSLVYEIQQSTDVTYRFYDYDRLDASGMPRPLQLEAALDCLDLHKKSTAMPYAPDTDYVHPYYATRYQSITGAITNPHNVFCCLTLLSGSLEYDGISLTPGVTALLLPNETLDFTGNAQGILAWPV